MALETRVRLALAVPRGGVGNSNRAVPRTADARANRARPTSHGSPRDALGDDARQAKAATNEAAA